MFPTQNDLGWFDLYLRTAVHDINMKFAITEPTFFLGQERKAGDELEAEVGPVKYVRALNGKMEPVPQYVELPHEIPTVIAPAQQSTPVPQNKFEPDPMSVTGALSLKAKFEAARVRKAAIEAKVEAALTSYNSAADMADSAIKSLEDDATALQAEVAGFTNGAPA